MAVRAALSQEGGQRRWLWGFAGKSAGAETAKGAAVERFVHHVRPEGTVVKGCDCQAHAVDCDAVAHMDVGQYFFRLDCQNSGYGFFLYVF